MPLSTGEQPGRDEIHAPVAVRGIGKVYRVHNSRLAALNQFVPLPRGAPNEFSFNGPDQTGEL
jgi:hypothetical protein